MYRAKLRARLLRGYPEKSRLTFLTGSITDYFNALNGREKLKNAAPVRISLNFGQYLSDTMKWFERKFDFERNEFAVPTLRERLAAFPLKLAQQVAGIPEQQLIRGKWSIKEHIGHLSDLEPLWQGRLEDIINGEKELRPTDLQNTETDLAGHNDVPLSELLEKFNQLRVHTVGLLDQITNADLTKTALHPRLKIPMRITDHLLFVAEHDEHHLDSILTVLQDRNDRL